MESTPAAPRVLAIHAHPDDVEFQCAGTLILLKERGCPITIVTMTAGDCGSAEFGPLEIARIRRGEAARSAELLGATYECLEFLDLQIVVDNDARRRVTGALRRARPDIVLTAPPVDYMSDHEMTSRLVRDATFMASVPNYATQQWDPAPPLKKIPYLYYVDPAEARDWSGQVAAAEFYVDITHVFEQKRQMVACHESQRNWLRQQHGIDDYVETMQRWSRHRGQECGVAYAEAFCQHKGHPYPQDNLLLELVGQDGRGRPVRG